MSDLKFAFRQLLKSPGFTAVAVITLALGIGANTAIFSLVNSVFLRSISGVRNPEELVAFDFKQTGKSTPIPRFSYPDFVDMRQGAEVFQDMAAFDREVITLGADERAEKIQALLVTPNYFGFLGPRMIAGRSFSSEEGKAPDADAVAVMSEGLWRRRFDSDPRIVGQAIHLNGRAFTVVGVATSFRVHPPYVTAEIWVPLTMHAHLRSGAAGSTAQGAPVDLLSDRSRSWLAWMGRLKPGVTAAQARAAVEVQGRRLGEAYGGGVLARYPLSVVPQAEYNRRDLDRAVPVAVFFLALAALVLLIACANLANLFLARAAARHQEFAVRLALGAPRDRLIRQLLAEGCLLASIGGAAALILGAWTAQLLGHFIGEIASRSVVPMRPEVAFDWNVFGYASCISMVAGVLFALAPALRASRPDLTIALKGETEAPKARARGVSWRGMLVIGQVAACFLVLAIAGLFFRGLQKARTMDLGFDPNGVLVLPIDLDSLEIPQTESGGLYRRIAERLSALPAVRQVCFAGFVQGDASSLSSFGCDTSSSQNTSYFAWGTAVSPGYFQTLDMPILRGRDFVSSDLNGPPVVIVNERMASQLWPGANAVGQQLKLAEHSVEATTYWAEVIGVAQDSHYLSLYQKDRRRFLYRPTDFNTAGSMNLLLRVNGDPAPLLPLLRTELRALDNRLPVYDLKPLNEKIAIWRLGPQLGAMLVGGIGLLGLLIASIGLYGLLAYIVGQRAREFGIRTALGATRRDVIGLVLRQGLTLTGLGFGLGLAAALGVTRLIRGLLFGVSPLDPTAFIGVSLLLLAVTASACCLPARRATRVDPMEALRHE